MENFAFGSDIIDYAASLAVGKANPFAYMNSIMLGWHNAGLTSLEQAKSTSAAPVAPPSGIVYEKYTADELNKLLTVVTEDDD